MIKINRKIDLIIIQDFMFDSIITIVIGSNRAISTSKIRKITAIKKNRKENGSRADLFGSNPHSNGELFSRSSIFFLDRIDVIIMITNVSVMVVVDTNAVMINT
jgi:hypothetical protein